MLSSCKQWRLISSQTQDQFGVLIPLVVGALTSRMSTIFDACAES